MSSSDIFGAIENTWRELEDPGFAADAPQRSPMSSQYQAELDDAGALYDWQLAHGTGTIYHDGRPYEELAGIPDNPGGVTGLGDLTGSSNNGSSNGSNGSSGNGKPPSWFQKWQAKQKQKQNSSSSKGRGGGGGKGLAGPKALGKFQPLGDVPTAPTGTSTGSPIVGVIVLGGVAIGAYLLWHKLRMARHQDKQMDKGEETTADAAG